MAIPKPRRRVPLQELMAQTNKHANTLKEWLHTTMNNCLVEMQEISRPRRKRSAYPRLVALQTALNNMHAVACELQQNNEAFREWLQQIDEVVKQQNAARK